MSHEQPNIGRLLQPNQGERDAIHVAIAPVVASCQLMPGQPIAFCKGSNELVEGNIVTPIGVVSPFLRYRVDKGQRFYMLLNPGSITSLRHDWTHPAFNVLPPTPEAVRLSKAWLVAFADDKGIPLDLLIDSAKASVEQDSDSLFVGSNEGLSSSSVNWFEFWHHFEQATGIKVESKRDMYFTCAC